LFTGINKLKGGMFCPIIPMAIMRAEMISCLAVLSSIVYDALFYDTARPARQLLGRSIPGAGQSRIV
jgi:hypothetical protein